MTAAFLVTLALLLVMCVLFVVAIQDRDHWRTIARRETRLRQSADETVEALLFDRPDATVLPFPRGGAS